MYTTLLWKTFCPGKTVRWRRTGCENFAHERTKNGNSLANRARLCYTLFWIIINKRNPAQGPERSCALGVLHTPAYNGRRTTAWKKRISRAARAAEVASQMHRAYLEGCVGQTYPVLYEQEKDGLYTGHAPNYCEVCVRAEDLHNKIIDTKIVGIDGDVLIGELT